jgi:hypothetical protein
MGCWLLVLTLVRLGCSIMHLAPELFQVSGVEGGCVPVIVHCFGCVSSVGVAAMLAIPLQIC